MKVLIIEDNLDDADIYKKLLEREGCEVEVATNASEGLPRAKRGKFDVILTDLNLGGGRGNEGHELITELRASHPHLPVILMTGAHTAQVAIDAIKLGAFDYFSKPINPFDDAFRASLADMIQSAAASKRLMAHVRLPSDSEGEPSDDEIIGASSAMLKVCKEIGRVAEKPVTVLIRGETGTGKELVARALWSHSDRKDQPFIVVNCAAIPENLLESELFGHEAGAFTGAKSQRLGRFELAHGGTIFLDEIGDMNIKLQQKLLRVLQENTIERVGGTEPISVNVRVVAATHRDLELAIQSGDFRQDLYFRLAVAVITLPPLRDRKEDVPALASHFIRLYGPALGADTSRLAPAASEILLEQSWPGNVRELRSVIRKALLLAHGYAITDELIRKAIAQTRPPNPIPQQPFATHVADLLAAAKAGERSDVLGDLTEVTERELYTQAINRAHGDQGKALGWLGVSYPTMREKLIRYGLHPRGAK